MHKPELSCIIITLNEEKYLPRLLKSLREQTFKDFEVIVADYNSKDNTAKIARQCGCRVTLGGTYSAGRNNGARISRGKYLLFLDADCVLPKNFLGANLRAFKKSKKGTATVSAKPFDGRPADRVFFILYDWWARAVALLWPHSVGAGIFVTREVFDELGGFDEGVVFAENHEFVRRGSRYGFTILPVALRTSARRIEKEGRLRFAVKYVYATVYRLLFGEIRKEIFSYEKK